MQSYNSFYFVVNMHLIWFSSWVFTLALAGDCAAQSSASQTNIPFSLKNIQPKIKLYTYADAESESELKYIKDSIPLGQDWKNQEISDLSLPTHWTKVVFECESRYSSVKWEVPDKAKLSGVQTESIRQQHGYSEPLVYLHKSYLILSNITDRLTGAGDYKCRAIQQQTSSRQLKNQENQGKTNSFYLFVPNGGDRLAKANDDNIRQEVTLYVATPFSINVADDKSLVSYTSSTSQFQFFSRKGRVEVASTPNDDKQGIIKVISPKGSVKTWKFIIIDHDLYEAKGFRQEECEINAEMDQDCEFKSFKCQSATLRPPKIHFTPLNEQGCPVKNRRSMENVIVTSCGIGCTKLMTTEQRGIVKCVGDGVEENNSEIRFPFDLYCSQSPYLIDRGNVIRVGSADNSSIIIPCTANHPQAPITLGKQHRVAPGMIDWQDKPVGFDGVEYDPKQGFLIDNNTTNIFGTYLCVSDRTLVDWRDHMVVHVDSSDGAREFEETNIAEDNNSKERNENEEEDEDESDTPVQDEELYLKQNSLRPDIADPIGEAKIPDLEYEIGKQYQFVCYGSRDVYSWGMFWSVETEDGEQFTVDDSFAMSESAITTALNTNTSGTRNVYSQVLLTFPVKEIKTLWCNAPVLNSPFEWRKISWPIIIADKEDRNCGKNGQTMRVSHLGASAEIVYELTRDNHITSRRRSYRHYVVPDASTSLGVVSNAGQPLTWSYEGITSPQPGITVSSFRSAPNFQDTDSYCYASELRFDNLTIEHTGQYIVSYATEPERHMSFYLFVSSTKPPFFLKSTGNRVPWNKDESVRLIIPCLVNSPNLRASLYKQSPHGLKEVTSSFTYDPRRGFTSKFSVLSQEEALGKYVCLARSPSTYSIDKTVIYVYDTQSESQRKQMVHNLGPVDLNEEYFSEEIAENENVQINGTFKEGSTTIRNNTQSHIIREVTIECSVNKPYASHGILWALRLQNDTLEFIEPLENGTVEFLNKENPNIITSRLKGHVSNTTENKAVECFVPVSGNSEWISHSFPISVFLQ